MSGLMPILLLEDNEVDVEIVKRTLKKAGIENPVHAVEDGVDALRVLRGEGTEAIPQPCLILVDINLPRMDGLTFLENMQQDQTLKQNTAFILTTSDKPEDKERAEQLDVKSYILKDGVNTLSEILKDYL
ncbi:MAG: response regulator [Rhodospirillales bacterium]|nr:response regulator [Rhodospirillales bacterium]MCB9995566.1 response regulator [Rhodospirillales bacterium]